MFVKTILIASEWFDSAPVQWMRGPCHLFVNRCFQLVKNVSGGTPDSVSACVFLLNNAHQHVREATAWFIRKLGIGGNGTLLTS